MAQMRLFLLIGMVFSLITLGCEKEELPVDPYPRGDIITASVDLEPDYRYQVYYHLESQSIVKKNLRTDWDLAFSCGEDNTLYINTSNVMQAGKTAYTALDNVTAAPTFMRPDHPSGNLDSLGLKGCLTSDSVWVVDRGFDPNGNHLGWIKLKCSFTNNESYSLEYAALDGSEYHSAVIRKDTRYNNICWSFKSHSLIQAEPEKTSWDICFTTYTNVFYDPYMPYLVTGVLLNPQAACAIDSTVAFEDLTLQHFSENDYHNRRDRIGYDWKEYSFDTGNYVIYPNKNYVIRSVSGFYYKLHFIDFYNNQGEKGYPTFELKLL